MVTTVNPEKSVNSRVDTTSQSKQRVSSPQDRQASAPAEAISGQAEDSQVDVETARQLYQMENHRAAAGSRITTPEQAQSQLGQLLQQISDNPGQFLQSHSPRSPVALSNLLERAPV